MCNAPIQGAMRLKIYKRMAARLLLFQLNFAGLQLYSSASPARSI